MSSQGSRARVDFGFLERLAAGDQGLMREVLEIFLAEADSWAVGLQDAGAARRQEAIHTLKGSARAIGAHELGDLCENWEAGEFEETASLLEELGLVSGEVRTWLSSSGT